MGITHGNAVIDTVSVPHVRRRLGIRAIGAVLAGHPCDHTVTVIFLVIHIPEVGGNVAVVQRKLANLLRGSRIIAIQVTLNRVPLVDKVALPKVINVVAVLRIADEPRLVGAKPALVRHIGQAKVPNPVNFTALERILRKDFLASGS